MVDLLNLICSTVESRVNKFNVNKTPNVGEFTSELVFISGMPNTMGKLICYAYEYVRNPLDNHVFRANP